MAVNQRTNDLTNQNFPKTLSIFVELLEKKAVTPLELFFFENTSRVLFEEQFFF